MNLCLYSLMDMGIHYRGWDAARTAAFLKEFGIEKEKAAEEIYQYIVETPGNYLKYYWGYLNFVDLRKKQEAKLGERFDMKKFHEEVLKIGPVPFPVLEKYINREMNPEDAKQKNAGRNGRQFFIGCVSASYV